MPVKLLIIRFSSIGDIVLTTPVIRCIFQQVKEVEVHFLTKKRFASIIESNPYISKVYTIESRVSEVINDLKKEKYDHIIDLHKNLRSGLVLTNLLKPYTAFNKLNFEKWLMVKFKINRLPNVHIVDRYMQAASFLGISIDNKGLDFFIPESEEVSFDGPLSILKQGYIAVVIGGNHKTKILPAEIVTDIVLQLNHPVAILGGKEDMERGSFIERNSNGKAVNLCGTYSLMESASLVKQSLAVLTNDTGLMHIAAAFNKPIASVWGNTIPEFGMYPYVRTGTPVLIAQVNDLKCRPCSKLGYPECPLKHFKCMKDQNREEIVSFLNSVV
jgi:ADP-heptose:LPS heptosyltransferase